MNGHSGPGSVYLRLSVTDRCNLGCIYCRPEGGPATGSVGAAASDAEILALVGLLDAELGIHKLRLTGGEPLVRPGLPGLVRELRRLTPEARLCLTTNGLLLRRHAAALREAGLDSVNVSLDSTDPGTFGAITRGGRLAGALDGIRAAREAGFGPPKINSVLMRRYGGSRAEDLVRFAARERCEIRFIELMPCGQGARLFDADFLPASEALRRLAASFAYVGPEPRSATAKRHRLRVDGLDVIVGFITAVSEPFCKGCDRLRLESRGLLVSCLRAAEGIDLLGPLRAGAPEEVRGRIRSCARRKRPPGDAWPARPMVAIGG